MPRIQFYIRLDGRDPDGAEQRAVLKTFPSPPGKWDSMEYVEQARRTVSEYPGRGRLVRALRSSADLVVVSDFWRLASRTGDLAEAVKEIRSKHKPVIIEARTGKRSDCQKDFAQMFAKAMNVYAGRTLSPERAKELGAAGAAKSSATKPKTGHMPFRNMAKIINEAPTMSVAIETINAAGYEPVTRIWIYRAAKAGKLKLKKRRGDTGAKSKP